MVSRPVSCASGSVVATTPKTWSRYTLAPARALCPRGSAVAFRRHVGTLLSTRNLVFQVPTRWEGGTGPDRGKTDSGRPTLDVEDCPIVSILGWRSYRWQMIERVFNYRSCVSLAHHGCTVRQSSGSAFLSRTTWTLDKPEFPCRIGTFAYPDLVSRNHAKGPRLGVPNSLSGFRGQCQARPICCRKLRLS